MSRNPKQADIEVGKQAQAERQRIDIEGGDQDHPLRFVCVLLGSGCGHRVLKMLMPDISAVCPSPLSSPCIFAIVFVAAPVDAV